MKVDNIQGIVERKRKTRTSFDENGISDGPAFAESTKKARPDDAPVPIGGPAHGEAEVTTPTESSAIAPQSPEAPEAAASPSKYPGPNSPDKAEEVKKETKKLHGRRHQEARNISVLRLSVTCMGTECIKYLLGYSFDIVLIQGPHLSGTFLQ